LTFDGAEMRRDQTQIYQIIANSSIETESIAILPVNPRKSAKSTFDYPASVTQNLKFNLTSSPLKLKSR
jgi:hypothetical protein